MIVEREMVLSYDLPIEEILEMIKKDIMDVKKKRKYMTNSIHIKTKIYA